MKNIVRKILICMTSATLGLSLLPSAALASELPSDTAVTEQPSAPTYQASSNATKPSDNKDSKPKISAAEARYNSAKKAYNSAKSARSKAKAALTKANSSLSKEKKAVKNKKKYAARYFVDSLIKDKKYRFDAQYNRARKDKDGNKISKYFGKNSKDKVLLAYNKTNFSNTIRMLKKCNNLRKS
ncbi:MAG: hypothetical protein DUD27_03800 [Lachnospiraceae bacterium]|nr:MAG: hypothetical protein DUD27_03800 [Lachnospiraceae bacterium]